MKAAFTAAELKIMQERPPERKVNVTYAKLIEYFIHTNFKIAVSFSGGKDSTVLLDMVARLWKAEQERHGGAPLVVVFANTTNEFRGMEAFVKQYCRYIEETHGIVVDLHIERGEENFYEVVKTRGYPVGSKFVSRQVRDIRRWMRQEGIRWDEIKNTLDDGVPSADRLRALNASHTVVLYLTGVKRDNSFTKHSKLPKRWRPLLNAPFEVSPDCCDILKKPRSRQFKRS